MQPEGIAPEGLVAISVKPESVAAFDDHVRPVNDDRVARDERFAARPRHGFSLRAGWVL